MSSSQSFLNKRLVSLTLGPFTFAPGWIATVVTTALLTLLINLGLWQKGRGDYKEAIIERYQERSQSGPQSIDTLIALSEDSMDFPIEVKGIFDHKRTLLLDNRTHRGIPGFQVLTPLDVGSHYVLVNRGWVAQGKTRQEVPVFPRPLEVQNLKGVTHVPNPNFFVLQEDNYQSVEWPFIIQKIDISKTQTLFDKPLAPFTIRLNPEENSGFKREWHSNPMTPEKHYGYAFQWFSLALALTVIYVTVNTRRNRPKNNKNASQRDSE
ncbi:MAG: SURF1 family protein [Pseudomonadales bacterium]|nr:SURF1 family protein [Pseudomonadales bacterium]